MLRAEVITESSQQSSRQGNMLCASTFEFWKGAGSLVEDTTMKLQVSAVLMSILFATGLGASAPAALADDPPAATPIQYGPYPDERYYPQDRYYPNDRRDGYAPYPPRDSYDRGAPLWRPGDLLPPQLLDYIVDDWEPRGLERPPGGHLWVRVDPQFILVRERDRMISRVINFD
jgi:Ni/Co efflux regulator RcnB